MYAILVKKSEEVPIGHLPLGTHLEESNPIDYDEQ